MSSGHVTVFSRLDNRDVQRKLQPLEVACCRLRWSRGRSATTPVRRAALHHPSARQVQPQPIAGQGADPPAVQRQDGIDQSQRQRARFRRARAPARIPASPPRGHSSRTVHPDVPVRSTEAPWPSRGHARRPERRRARRARPGRPRPSGGCLRAGAARCAGWPRPRPARSAGPSRTARSAAACRSSASRSSGRPRPPAGAR